MKTFAILFLVAVFAIGLSLVAQGAPLVQNCTGGTLGAPYKGVQAYSNVPYQGTPTSCGGDADVNRGTYGYRYQCVEFVRRFYATNNGTNRANANDSWPRVNAADMWDYPTAMGLKRMENGATEWPQPDDILVFDRKSVYDVGHVAIVVAVTATSIKIVEQNWDSTGYKILSAQSIQGGTYFVPIRSGYPIRGWMGRRITTPPSTDDSASWTQKSPSNSPSPGRSNAMAYDAAHGQVVLFGGGALNDTWVWDGTNWTQKSPSNSPSLLGNSAMTYDAARGQIVLFGGYAGNDPVNDTWVWDGTNWTQKSPSNSPPPCLDPEIAYDAARGQIVLFGGVPSSLPADTWIWDGTNWTQQSAANSPPPRRWHAMAYDAARRQIVLFGGYDPYAYYGILLNDTWVWK